MPCKLSRLSVIAARELIISAIGNLVIAGAITANGTIGSRHHIPFSIAARASMGFYFSYFAVVSRLVLGLVYFGYVHGFSTRIQRPAADGDTLSINTMIGSSCMYIMLKSIWPSLDRLPNTIPEHIGITSGRMIAFFVFWLGKLI